MDKIMVVDSEDLIVVKQLPIIEDRLDEAYQRVQDRLSLVKTYAVTDDNYKQIKKTRAELNKEFNDLETLRKRVKSAVEAPYKAFESGAYKKLADAYTEAVKVIDVQIKDVENGLKEERQKEVYRYADEYRQSLGLDSKIADLSRSGIKIGLTGSMKFLKEQAKGFIDRVDGDLKMIETLENADEVLAEYRILLSVTDAVRNVADRHKRIAEEKARREAEAESKKQREESEAKVDEAVKEAEALSSPKEIEPEEEIVCAKYLGIEIFGTMGQLKALKEFLKETLIEYLEEEGIKYNG